MHFDQSDLLLAWMGGGFVFFLFWAAVMGEAMVGSRRAAVPPAIGVLAVLGLFHPAAAVAAVDLVRLCATSDEPALQLPRWAPAATTVMAGTSVVGAVALWLQSSGAP